MISQHPHPLVRSLGAQRGNTLIELLVTLALVVVCATLPVSGLTAALTQQSNRNNALICQAAAVAAQMRALCSASGCTVAWDEESLTLAPDSLDGVPLAVLGSVSGVDTNVPRWRRGSGVSVRFLPVTASPDSAGSVYFGDQGRGQRVVVRLASGLTRRESR